MSRSGEIDKVYLKIFWEIEDNGSNASARGTSRWRSGKCSERYGGGIRNLIPSDGCVLELGGFEPVPHEVTDPITGLKVCTTVAWKPPQ